MLRDGCAQDIVHAEECVEKVAAVQEVHRHVPEAGHDEKERQSAQHVDAAEHGQPPLPEEEDQDDQSRQRKADRPLIEDGERGRSKSQIIIPAPAALITGIKLIRDALTVTKSVISVTIA